MLNKQLNLFKKNFKTGQGESCMCIFSKVGLVIKCNWIELIFYNSNKNYLLTKVFLLNLQSLVGLLVVPNKVGFKILQNSRTLLQIYARTLKLYDNRQQSLYKANTLCICNISLPAYRIFTIHISINCS